MKRIILLSILIGVMATSNAVKLSSNLEFDKSKFEMRTKTVVTSSEVVTIKYRAYLHIPYVAKPIDVAYQSLSLFVPEEINGKKIDAFSSPILFSNRVGGYMPVNDSKTKDVGDDFGSPRENLALASGIVVVVPGCRGRVNQSSNGTYYGKAPAAIVDLKAAIRYLRHNANSIPGDKEKIISVGCSAGGDISAVLGASGNSPLFDNYLHALGAADERDDFYAVGVFSPIMDIEHADMAYEWEFGDTEWNGAKVNKQLSDELKQLFSEYEKSLNLKGKGGFNNLTADNLGEYIAKFYLNPSATDYLKNLPKEERDGYLKDKGWMKWNGTSTCFTLKDYTTHYVGRYKGLPAFDSFELKSSENGLFGNETTDARHMTNFTLRHVTNNPNAEVDKDLQQVINLMNPMFFVMNDNEGCAQHWWIRHGTTESGISRAMMVNLSTALENRGKDIDSKLFWEAMHCVDTDPDGFIKWIKNVCKTSDVPTETSK